MPLKDPIAKKEYHKEYHKTEHSMIGKIEHDVDHRLYIFSLHHRLHQSLPIKLELRIHTF